MPASPAVRGEQRLTMDGIDPKKNSYSSFSFAQGEREFFSN
jgi:hypothetical protein